MRACVCACMDACMCEFVYVFPSANGMQTNLGTVSFSVQSAAYSSSLSQLQGRITSVLHLPPGESTPVPWERGELFSFHGRWGGSGGAPSLAAGGALLSSSGSFAFCYALYYVVNYRVAFVVCPGNTPAEIASGQTAHVVAGAFASVVCLYSFRSLSIS